MVADEENRNTFDKLRRKAEEIAKTNSGPIAETEDLKHLLYELRVCRIELENQNEELRKTQKQATKLKEKYKELFEFAPVGYIVLDNNYVIKDINYTGEQLLKKPRDFIIDSPLSRYVDSHSNSTLSGHFSELSSKGTGKSCEIKLLNGDVSPLWVRLESTITENAGKDAEQLLVAIIDITEKKPTNLKLQQSRKEYTNIVETANSIITKIDREGRITFLNQYGLEFLGFEKESVIGKPAIGTILPEKDAGSGKDWSIFLNRILENPEDFQDHENENIRADGTPVWIHWRNKSLIDTEGRITGILGIGNDITERKIAEEIIKRDRENLEALVKERTNMMIETQKDLEQSRRLADLGRLSSSIAHELRRPLAAIKLSTHNIRKKRTNPDIDKNINHCEEKIAEADGIISSILESSSLKRPNYQDVDLSSLISAELNQIETNLLPTFTNGESGHIRRVLDPLQAVRIKADPYQIKEVVHTIVKNAMEATDWEPEKVSVIGFLTEETAGFKVIDRDLGIAENMLPLLTDPFYTTKHQGLGLGLTVAEEIIHRHTGTLEITSSLGRGTTVTVTIPREI